jgi:hypothetical protein
MGDMGAQGGPQARIASEMAKKEATERREKEELQQKSLEALKRKKSSFAGNLPTSLFTDGNKTLG